MLRPSGLPDTILAKREGSRARLVHVDDIFNLRNWTAFGARWHFPDSSHPLKRDRCATTTLVSWAVAVATRGTSSSPV